MGGNLLKSIGMVCTVVGLATNVVSGWVENQKMEMKINKAVEEAVKKAMESKES